VTTIILNPNITTTLSQSSDTFILGGDQNDITLGSSTGGVTGDTLTGGGGTFIVYGGNNTLTLDNWSYVYFDLVSGAKDTGETVNASFTGVALHSFASVAVVGANNGATLLGNSATLTATGIGDGITIQGSFDVVNVQGAGATSVADNGVSALVNVDLAAVTLTISDFGSDASGIVDLKGSAAAVYATPSAAYTALTSDGHGGSLLSFASGGTTVGSIDFVNTPAAALSSANFKIG
jgi:hypothetical protein